MMSVKTCSDTTEAIALEPGLGLYLKPVSKIKINVQLPKLTVPGQSISSWNVMEKLKATVRPDTFLYLKALKIASNVIKFEGELETKSSSERALARLRAAGSLKLSGFAEKLQIRAAHAACNGPTRHDWEAFFRDAKGVNEMKPGERPDTIHLEEMPVRWFAESSKSMTPSEKLLRKAFGSFGKIRRLEIPRSLMAEDSTFRKTSILHSDLLFEAYIQYEEYVEFSIAMDSMRGKKLLYKEPDGNVYSADIKVDFDRTNYLSDKCIRKREAESKKLDYMSSPERIKKTSHEDKNVTVTKPTIGESSLITSEAPSQVEECLPHKHMAAKEIADQQHSDAEKSSKREAKLLLKELFHRAEMHERKMDEKMKHVVKYPVERKTSQKGTQKSDNINVEKEQSRKRISTQIKLKQTKELKIKSTDRKKESDRDIVNSTNFQKAGNKRKLIKENKEDRKNKQALYDNEDRLLNKSKKERGKEVTQCKKQNQKESMHEHEDKKCKDKAVPLHVAETKLKKEKFSHCKDKKEKNIFYYEEKKIKGSLVQVHDDDRKNKEKLIQQERILKEKLLQKLKVRQEEQLKSREKLRKELAGRKVLKSVLADTNHSLQRKG